MYIYIIYNTYIYVYIYTHIYMCIYIHILYIISKMTPTDNMYIFSPKQTVQSTCA